MSDYNQPHKLIMKKEEIHCHKCESGEKRLRIGKNLKIVGVIFIAVFVVSFHPSLSSLNKSLISYLEIIWWAILLGLIIGGIIEYFVPKGFVFKYLGQKRKTSLFYGIIAGFIMSACSNGILAISMQLYKKGASIPTVITFLLALPLANLSVTILLFGFFGWKALLFVLTAIFIALLTGFIYIGLEKANLVEQSERVYLVEEYERTKVKNFDLKNSIKGVIVGGVDLANMVLWWILIGILIAAIIGAYVPEFIFTQYL